MKVVLVPLKCKVTGLLIGAGMPTRCPRGPHEWEAYTRIILRYEEDRLGAPFRCGSRRSVRSRNWKKSRSLAIEDRQILSQ